MKAVDQSLEQLCINTIRVLAMDAVQKANSGHPGLPMGAAPMAYVLWMHHLRHNPTDPHWPNRDRFVDVDDYVVPRWGPSGFTTRVSPEGRVCSPVRRLNAGVRRPIVVS